MVMASCVAVLFGDKIRSQSKPFYIYFNWPTGNDAIPGQVNREIPLQLLFQPVTALWVCTSSRMASSRVSKALDGWVASVALIVCNPPSAQNPDFQYGP